MGTWASQTYLEGYSTPKILQQRGADIVKWPSWPRGKLHWWTYKTSSNCQQHETDTVYTLTPHRSDIEHPTNQTERGRGGGKPVNVSWLWQRILGQPFSTSSSNLGPRTGLGRTQEPCFFCTIRNPALWCSMLHSLTEAKEHFSFFPTFLQKRHYMLRSEHPKAWPSLMGSFLR